MSKYNVHATKQDWEHLYTTVEALGMDSKPYHKSQNFDQAVYAFYVETKQKFGITLGEVQKKYPMYTYDKTVQAVIN